MSRIRTHWPLFFLVVAVFAVFHRAFFSGILFWDDDVFLLRNNILKMPFLPAVSAAFSSYYHGDYLPLTIMSYWLETQMWGINAAVFHTTNLLLHAFNVILVYILIYKFKPNRAVAFFITFLFALHPLQTEPVLWISERKSLLSGTFTLGSLLSYIMFLEKSRPRFFIFALIMYAASLLSKTTAILLPIVFFALDRFKGQGDLKSSLRRLIPLLLVVASVGYIRVLSYDYSTPGIAENLWNKERWQGLPLMVANVMWFYIQKFFWPYPLASIYPFMKVSVQSYIEGTLGLIALLGIGFLIFKQKLENAKIFFALYLLFLLPILHLVPRANFANDRYMYLPIIGLAFVLWELAESFLPPRLITKAAASLVGLLFLPLALLAYDQSKIWESNLTLWEDAVRKSPDSVLARNALGLEYQERQRYEDAIAQYDHVLKMEVPAFLKMKSINNLANIYTDRNFSGYNPDQAIQLYELALSSASRPNLTYEIRINLAQVHLIKGDKERYRTIMQQVYEEVRGDPDSRNHWLLDYITNTLKQTP